HPRLLVLVQASLPAAAFARAPAHRAAALRHLLGDERCAAAGARREDRLVPDDERALGIPVAAVERGPAARAAPAELALAPGLAPAADRALDAGGTRLERRLDALAVVVAGTAEELAEAAEAHLHRLAADLAGAVGQLGLDGPDAAVLVTREVRRVAALGIAAA